MTKQSRAPGPISAALARPGNGGARRGAGRPPDLARRVRDVTDYLRSPGAKLSQAERSALRLAIDELIAFLDEPIII